MEPFYAESLFPIYQEDNTFYEEIFNNNNKSKSINKMSYYTNYQQQQPPAPAVVPPHQQHQQIQPPPANTTSTQQLKRKMTLDLNTAKRPRFPGTQDAVLSSPDVQKLQIPTPELERLIMSTTNPNVLQTPTSLFFPKNITEEQEQYAKGFENALKQLHDQSNTTSSSFNDHDDTSSSSYASSMNMNKHQSNNNSMTDFSNVVIKEEPQTVPDDSNTTTGDDDDTADDDDASLSGSNFGGSINPIDMASQEKIKLERKRQRNRLAASKCRRKKLERIAKLEDKVKQLKGENNELGNVLVKLRECVQQLKSQVMEHVQAGCAIVVNFGTNNSNFS